MINDWTSTGFDSDLQLPHYWTCPNCSHRLNLEKDNLHFLESKASRISREFDGNPFAQYRFTALLSCARCLEVVAVSGTASDVQWEGENTKGESIEMETIVFTPDHFLPPIQLFPLPVGFYKKQEINNAIIEAFGLFFVDTSACANKVRVAVEFVLTDQGVKRTTINVKGKREEIKTHARIDIFKKKNPALGVIMEAIKWIGNNGSHAGEHLTKYDLATGFEMLEHVIEALYGVSRQERLLYVAKGINKKKGVKRRSTRPFKFRGKQKKG